MNNDTYSLIQEIQMYEHELEDLKRNFCNEYIQKYENKIETLKKELFELENKQFFMECAIKVSQKSKCKRKKVGCVIVKDNLIIAKGYNRPPLNSNLCKNGCLKEKLFNCKEKYEVCNSIHAEVNSIISALKNNKDLNNSTIFLTLSPCLTCAKLIIEVGIKKVVYRRLHNDSRVFDMFKKFNISTEVIL